MFKKCLAAVPPGAAAVASMTGVSPTEAKSNLSQWLELVGLPPLDHILTQAVDQWVFAISLIILVIWLGWMFRCWMRSSETSVVGSGGTSTEASNTAETIGGEATEAPPAVFEVPITADGKDVANLMLRAPGLDEKKCIYARYMTSIRPEDRLFERFVHKAYIHCLEEAGESGTADEVYRVKQPYDAHSARDDIEFAFMVGEARNEKAT